MKRIAVCLILGLGFLVAVHGTVMARDMRTLAGEAEQKKAEILEKAKQEAQKARAEVAESSARILSDKQALKNAIEELKRRNRTLHEETQGIENRLSALVQKEKDLTSQVGEKEGTARELVGSILAAARDLDGLVGQSLHNALSLKRLDFLKSIVGQTTFPGMDEIRHMVDLLFDEIQRSGEVRTEPGIIVNRAGEETTGKILIVGNFSAAYRLARETGFLLYSDASQRLFALSKLPKGRVAKKIEQYMDGKCDDVPIDISRGAAVRQFAHSLNLWEQIPKGGPIVVPILGICVLALLIILERLVYLFKIHMDAENFMLRLTRLVFEEKWQACEALCEKFRQKPIARVLLAGICFKDMSRMDMENALQEAILNEVPHLERFLSTLGMLAAISPLLGLLGTVTGMMNIFHVITFYGTGDPKMMSGGISEALVTTMLGLSVAIPIMFCHTLLNRKVESTIGQMEEKAISFVNTVFKIRNGN